MARPLAVTLACTFFATSLAAQSTWVVDAAGGPGAHFTTLQSAVDFAVGGDTLLVRQGDYQEFTAWGKGLTILGDPGARVVDVTSGIVNVPATERFVLRGLDFVCTGFCQGSSLNIGFNAGPIHLEDVAFANRLEAGISVNTCAQLTMTNCRGNARGCLSTQLSTVALTDCDFYGEIGVYLLGSPGGVRVLSGTVEIAGGSYRGGDGQGTGPFQVVAGPGIEVFGGSVSITGNDTIVEAGNWAEGGQVALSAGFSTVVKLDPAVSLIPKNASETSGTVTVTSVPALTGSAVPGEIDLRLQAPVGDAYVMYASFPMTPFPQPTGLLWINPFTAVLFTSGTVDPTGERRITLPLLVSYDGTPLVFQGLTANAGGLSVTSAVTVVLP
ncbi:MAG: hypothetical protein AAF628_04000 [Planctomycetota bacterium]